jgi:dextranase
MNKKYIVLLFTVALVACKKNSSGNNNPITPGIITYTISTNKAKYNPGETVAFKLNEIIPGGFIRYRFLNEIIKEEPLSAASWNWLPPAIDYRGYIVELFTKEAGGDKTQTSIAVDVSSNWSRFPRYGFLSEFEQKSNARMDSVVHFLNRAHINGLQFYDWQDKHHQPLAGTIASPSAGWKDIANRATAKATVDGYISRAHQYGMQAMFYNLCYGALSDAAGDGVQAEWYLYKNTTHTDKDGFILPKPPFKSDIFFTDPSNTGWQRYIAKKNSDVYQVFDFDGYHVDQVGDRGTVYDHSGKQVDLAATFHSFLIAMKAAHPGKKLVMNSVNQFGQENSISTAPVDFTYAELWTGNEGYKELAASIQNNYKYSNGKSSVIAAYLNYNKAENPGTFNTAGVLMANTVIFAFGGSHIELGEHMLAKEYFPNHNLSMNDDLKKAIIAYYDFLTAYENLLRDGGTFHTLPVNCINGKMNVSAWPPERGKVAVVAKQVGSKQVLHFINFANASSFDWRDTNGTLPVPNTIAAADMEVHYSGTATKIWLASPDNNFGIPIQLNFTQTGSTLKFTLPQLKYWDMLVIE